MLPPRMSSSKALRTMSSETVTAHRRVGPPCTTIDLLQKDDCKKLL
jgi:hypothetical protein